MDLNKAQVIGRITQDIELRQTPNGQNVTSFSVATNRRWKDSNGIQQDLAEFHNVVLWGKLAEIAGQYLQKGKRVFIEGRLQTRNWEAQDGSKRYKTEIVGDNMIMLDNKSGENMGGGTPMNTEVSKPSVSKKSPSKEEEISVEDIPF